MRAKPLYLFAAALMLAACSGEPEGDEAAGTEGGGGQAVESPGAPAAADTQVMPAAAGSTQPGADHGEIAMNPVGSSGVTGTLSLRDAGSNQTAVTLSVAGAQPGTMQAHIHQGTCAQPGQVVAPLEPVTVAQGGGGSSLSTVPVPLQQVMNGQHIVAAHEVGGSPGAPVVCAEITSHAM